MDDHPGLVPLTLPTPAAMRGPWAAYAAVHTVVRRGCGTGADGPVWHYADGSGDWADLVVLGGGRAVLIGDHVDAVEVEETDLMAGAPGWWAAPARAAQRRDGCGWVGFVYGYADGQWHRAAYGRDDGFAGVQLPALDQRVVEKAILDVVRAVIGVRPNTAAVRALVRAGCDATTEQVAAVVGPTRDAEEGAAAARAFREAPI